MKVTLTKEMLVHMIKGTNPTYGQMDEPRIKLLGRFNGSYGTWSWGRNSLETSSEEELLSIYRFLTEGD
jgi:hypothetical protein